MKLDLHVHTNHSIDAIIKPEDLAKKSEKLGIIPAITDHNSVRCHSRMRSLGIPFIQGEEIRTDRGDVIGLYINELIPKKTPFEEALDKIHEQGAVVFLPHMYDRTRAGVIPNNRETAKIDIIETFNARSLSPNNNAKAKEFAEKHSKLQAAGSDSHFLMEFGSTYNEVPDFDLENPKELLRALKKAKFVTKRAPVFVRGTTSLVKLSKSLFR